MFQDHNLKFTRRPNQICKGVLVPKPIERRPIPHVLANPFSNRRRIDPGLACASLHAAVNSEPVQHLDLDFVPGFIVASWASHGRASLCELQGVTPEWLNDRGGSELVNDL